MKTAIDWLRKELEYYREFEEFYTRHYLEIDAIFNEAKSIEKEQMKIYSIDVELFNRLPIEGTNFCSFNVNEFRYFTTKYYLDNFKETYKK
jgi:hypothetical protein